MRDQATLCCSLTAASASHCDMRGARTACDWDCSLCCSFKRAKQPGKLTRLLSCTEDQLETYKGLDLVTTHVVPSLTLDPNKEHNDHYSAYNKPGAVMFWLQVMHMMLLITTLLSVQDERTCYVCAHFGLHR